MTIYMNYHKPSVTLATEAKALTPKQYPHMHIFSPHGSQQHGPQTDQPTMLCLVPGPLNHLPLIITTV